MDVQANPLHEHFGAELVGLELAELDDGQARSLDQAIGRWGLVLIRGVDLADPALAGFAARLGPLQNMSPSPDPVHVIHVSNIGKDGRLKTADDATRRQHDANRLWHADSSFLSPGATYSLLLARIVPADGGDTEFLDARVAWEALDAARQRELSPLTAEHSILHSWRLVGVEPPASSPAKMAPVARKLVRRHAPSDRNSLVIPSHVERIVGFDDDQSRALLGELTAIASAPDRVYRHRWREGDLLIWDNRCMLHRATPYRAFEAPRDLSSCRVLDVQDDGLAP